MSAAREGVGAVRVDASSGAEQLVLGEESTGRALSQTQLVVLFGLFALLGAAGIAVGFLTESAGGWLFAVPHLFWVALLIVWRARKQAGSRLLVAEGELRHVDRRGRVVAALPGEGIREVAVGRDGPHRTLFVTLAVERRLLWTGLTPEEGEFAAAWVRQALAS